MSKTVKSRLTKGYPHLIMCRISELKFKELVALLKRDSNLTMSELIRRIIEKQAVTVRVKSTEMAEVLEELVAIYGKLQKIGVNLNQMVKAFHGSNSSIQKFLLGKKVNQDQQHLLKLLQQLEAILIQLQHKWLSE
jgi:hypothetical protein